jgi:hypothetical protein
MQGLFKSKTAMSTQDQPQTVGSIQSAQKMQPAPN